MLRFSIMKKLGHRSIHNTMIYIDIERAIYGSSGNEQFVSRSRLQIKEACKFVEAGFGYVTDWGDARVFQKRRQKTALKKIWRI